MTRLVNRLQRLIDPPPPAMEVLAHFASGTDGARITALALAILAPAPEHLPMALDSIQNRRSQFEQFQALSLAQGLLKLLDPLAEEQVQLAVKEQMGTTITPEDSSRWQIAQRILKQAVQA